jgi:hypothetical protein
MVRSLFLFDMTFWLYLASFTLYVGYVLARRPAPTCCGRVLPGI